MEPKEPPQEVASSGNPSPFQSPREIDVVDSLSGEEVQSATVGNVFRVGSK